MMDALLAALSGFLGFSFLLEETGEVTSDVLLPDTGGPWESWDVLLGSGFAIALLNLFHSAISFMGSLPLRLNLSPYKKLVSI